MNNHLLCVFLVKGKERERERGRGREGDGEREGERERERERERKWGQERGERKGHDCNAYQEITNTIQTNTSLRLYVSIYLRDVVSFGVVVHCR